MTIDIDDREAATKWAEREYRNIDAFSRNDLEIAIKAYSAGRASIPSATPPAPDADWQWVPKTPTEDMIVAFAEAWYSKVRCIDDCEMEDAYADMLAAAPVRATPPVLVQQEPGFVRVPVAAYLWLMGMGDDGFIQQGRGNYWWRSEFNKRAGLDMMEVYKGREPQEDQA